METMHDSVLHIPIGMGVWFYFYFSKRKPNNNTSEDFYGEALIEGTSI